MKQILIKTDMTEMPKGCADCDFADLTGELVGSGSKVELKISMAACKLYDSGVIDYIKHRPEWCPLVEHFVDANKTIGGEK